MTRAADRAPAPRDPGAGAPPAGVPWPVFGATVGALLVLCAVLVVRNLEIGAGPPGTPGAVPAYATGSAEAVRLLGAPVTVVVTSPREEVRLADGRLLRVGDRVGRTGRDGALVLETIGLDRLELASADGRVTLLVR